MGFQNRGCLNTLQRIYGDTAVTTFLLVVLLAASTCTASAAEASTTSAGHKQLDSVSVRFYNDQTSRLSETDVTELPEHLWQDVEPGGVTTFGYSASAIWCHIRIMAPADESVVIELPTTRLDHVHWFQVTDGKPVQIGRAHV